MLSYGKQRYAKERILRGWYELPVHKLPMENHNSKRKYHFQIGGRTLARKWARRRQGQKMGQERFCEIVFNSESCWLWDVSRMIRIKLYEVFSYWMKSDRVKQPRSCIEIAGILKNCCSEIISMSPISEGEMSRDRWRRTTLGPSRKKVWGRPPQKIIYKYLKNIIVHF